MGRTCSLPGYLTHHVLRSGKAEFMCLPFTVRLEEPACVIEMQMTEKHHIDIPRRNAKRSERRKKHVLLLDHPITLSQLRFKEGSHSCLNQDLARSIVYKKTPAGELNAPLFVRLAPALPHRPRCIAKHRSAIET